MAENKQNSMITVTTIDETTGNTILVHIPMTLDAKMINVLLDLGSNCENKKAIQFELTENADVFWTNLWVDLQADEVEPNE